MFFIYSLLAKLIRAFVLLLNRGSGFSLPGYVLLKLNPSVLSSSRIRFKKGLILISGTNGKTTTAKLITHVLNSNGLKVIHNDTGSNLLRGIVSAVFMNTSLLGGFDADVGVFEVDEFALPALLNYFKPSVLVLLNLSRDQLDRYGEVDIIFDRWREAVSKLSSSSYIVADSEQEEFKELHPVFPGILKTFGSDSSLLHHTKLHGKFNAKNVNAAYMACSRLGFEKENITEKLGTFKAAYGRGESFVYGDKNFTILLAKNPASFNNNLDLVNSGKFPADTLFFILNDNLPDGRDVSWIYDIHPDKLFEACKNKNIFVGGTRFLDMAVRLKYAGVLYPDEDKEKNSDNLNNDLGVLIKKITGSEKIMDVLILPNYSSMLEIRKLLLGRKIL